MKIQTTPPEPPNELASLGQINIALFCGGRGSASIIHELLQWPNIQLTLIVNAYDDGLSTGALRQFISQMLGPSDFRKNLSYLLDPFSTGQYALKQLFELRLPESNHQHDITCLQRFIKTQTLSTLPEPLQSLFGQISAALSTRLCSFLQIFFHYAHSAQIAFDYRDCSIGNLIFAGAYLEKENNFNAAAKEISQLVSSRALLVNVSSGENRILVGLKDDGELLMTEASIVGKQSSVPICDLFFVQKPIDSQDWQHLIEKSLDVKTAWLHEQESLPQISPEALHALNQADIILFGPGTQHSSLLPSYRIAEQALKNAPAPLKALIMNLGPDHDIQSLSTADIVDTALKYMGDRENECKLITHVLLNNSDELNTNNPLAQQHHHKNALIIQDQFANQFKNNIHNGRVVVETILGLWEKSQINNLHETKSISIFIDMHQRSLALPELHEELLEIDWKQLVGQVHLTVNQSNVDGLVPTETIKIKTADRRDHFPEIGYFSDWLRHENSEYLILLTGDGKYCFRDAILGIKLLEQGHFGAVFGSRNQSRAQFQASLRAVYGEKKLLSTLSFLGSFLISALVALRCRMLFSDPLTGFRLFKRSRMSAIMENLEHKKISTPISLTTFLIKNHIEIAELPVTYRTFAGFVDPHWRIQRGLKNLVSTLRRPIS